MATVVIIEDEDTMRQTFAEVLKHGGHKPIAFADAALALGAINFAHVDLVITDLAMPMRGEEAIHILRSSGATVPIIVVSGVLKPGEDMALQSIGADRVLAKPVGIKTLLYTIDELLPAC
jgi:DNA-binding response OmpR family regulator